MEVINESHGRIEDESHFKAIVVSDSFEVTCIQLAFLLNSIKFKGYDSPYQ